MSLRVKIHVDMNEVKPVTPEMPCITICDMDGTILDRGRKVILKGSWVLRQYRNNVPCGASCVLYSEDDDATYVMEARE